LGLHKVLNANEIEVGIDERGWRDLLRHELRWLRRF